MCSISVFTYKNYFGSKETNLAVSSGPTSHLGQFTKILASCSDYMTIDHFCPHPLESGRGAVLPHFLVFSNDEPNIRTFYTICKPVKNVFMCLFTSGIEENSIQRQIFSLVFNSRMWLWIIWRWPTKARFKDRFVRLTQVIEKRISI